MENGWEEEDDDEDIVRERGGRKVKMTQGSVTGSVRSAVLGSAASVS